MPHFANLTYTDDVWGTFCQLARHTCRGEGRVGVLHSFEPVRFRGERRPARPVPPSPRAPVPPSPRPPQLHWRPGFNTRHPSWADLQTGDCAEGGGTGEIQLRWDRYGAQRAAAAAFKEYVLFVDTSDAMALRRDGHPAKSKAHGLGLDCMHWCFGPGNTLFEPFYLELEDALRGRWSPPGTQQCGEGLRELCPGLEW